MEFLNTFISVAVIVVLAVPGFVLKRANLLPENATNVLAALLLFVSQPFLMAGSLLNKEFAPSMLPAFAQVFVFAIVLEIGVYLLAKPMFCKCKEDSSRRASIACSFLGNVGFMGIPVMEMLFPGDQQFILYAVIYNVVFGAISWTLGVYVVTGDRSKIKLWKIILNPPTLASLLAMPFFFCNVHIPVIVLKPISFLGNMTLPLSMIILGVRLANVKFSSLFKDLKVYGVALMKLVISPLFSLGVMLLIDLIIPLNKFVIIGVYIISAMPSASVVLSFAELYDGDKELAAKATLMNTLLCILTIPLLMILCDFI